MNRSDWDWTPGEKIIADLHQWQTQFQYIDPPCVSPDGERVAAIVRMDEAPSFICETRATWERGFDKIWGLQFLPDHRLTAIVSEAGAWTVAVEGVPWENWFDFIWDVHPGGMGHPIIAAAQTGGQYFAVIDGVPWKNAFQSLNHLTVSADGRHAAAVVQTVSFNSGDVLKFKEGCFTVAKDGNAWPDNFLNVWDLAFSPDNRHVAAESRITIDGYTIIVDGQPWDQTFSSVWKPLFHPYKNSITAPVKLDNGWSLAEDGRIIWDRRFFQLWHHAHHPHGTHIAAIAAPRFGRWTIAVDAQTWPLNFEDLVTDMVFSPDGSRIACVGKTGARWYAAVDRTCWDGAYDMVWKPVFSDDSRHVAVKTEKDGGFFFIVDGIPLPYRFVRAWDPIFHPSGNCLLLRAITADGVFTRHVIQLDRFKTHDV